MLHITTTADLISLIGHSLDYWPQASLVHHAPRNRTVVTLRRDSR